MNAPATDIIYLYGLIDPRNKKCRYLGISENPKRRLIQHNSQPTTLRLRAWFDELKAEKHFPQIRIFHECFSWTEARYMEDEWIKTLALSNDLINMKSNPITEKKGATPGPKPMYDEKIRRYSVSLTPTQADHLMVLGEGNLSLGVRRALALSLRP